MTKNAPNPKPLHLASLVEILAKIDALFLPDRRRTTHSAAVKHEARARYATAGIAFYSAAGDMDSRKQVQLVRDELAAAGMVRLMRPRSDRSLGVCLTSAGEATARSAAGLPGLADTVTVMDMLWELRTDPNGFDGWHGDHLAAWSNEQTLAMADYAKTADPSERQKLVALEERTLPGLLRGWVAANSDAEGRVWYALSPRFKAAPSTTSTLSPTPSLPRRSKGLATIYYRTLRAELARLAYATPLDAGEIGPIPLPAAPVLRRFATPEGLAAEVAKEGPTP